MDTLEFKVGVDDKHISKIFANIRDCSIPISELIWNSLDADAKKVEVELNDNGGSGIFSVSVKDNGHGISLETLNQDFKDIGKTSKARKSKSPDGRCI